MNKHCLVILSSLFFTVSVFAQASELPFKYESSKTHVGTATFFKISDMDSKSKSKPYYITEYQQDETTFYDLGDLSDMYAQVQDGYSIFDTNYFCYNKVENYNPYAYAKLANSSNETTITYYLSEQKAEGTMSYFNLFKKLSEFSGNLKLKASTSYEVSGFLLDFLYAMRFYNGDFSNFSVGIHSVLKSFEAEVSFEGQENYNNKQCDKWKVTKLDSKGKQSDEYEIIWFEKVDGIYNPVKIEAHLDGLVFKNSFIEVVEQKQLTPSEWEKYKQEMIEELRIKLSIPEDK